MSLEFKYYKIDDIGEVVSGGTPSTSKNEYWYGDIGWITPKDLSTYEGIYISRGERNISFEGLNNSSARLLPKNTVLMTSRAPIGYIAIANNELSTNQGFKSLICDEEICYYKYFYYWLKLNIKYIINNANGSTFNEISGGTFKNLEISLPSITEQKAISSVLWTLDEKISVLKRINKNLEEQLSLIFDDYFVKCSAYDEDSLVKTDWGKIPKEWKNIDFGELIQITSGDRPDEKSETKTSEFNIPLFGASKIMGYTKEYSYDEDILIIGRVGTHGVVQRVNYPCFPSDNTFVIKSKYYGFVYQLLKRIDYDSLNTGSTQPLITQKSLKTVNVILPDENSLSKFEKISKVFFDKIYLNQNEITSLTKLRDTLLPKLMSGEIDVSKINCDLTLRIMKFILNPPNYLNRGINMKTKIISKIQNQMKEYLNPDQYIKLTNSLLNSLQDVDIIDNNNELCEKDNFKLLDLFLSAKQVEGRSPKTITYYKSTIEKMLVKIKKQIYNINTDDLRKYLFDHKNEKQSSKTTIDNIRRILSSFFSWLEDEDYILKNPVRRIHKVKTGRTVKEVLTDENLETLRDKCDEIRDLAMLELLISTGIRVGELVRLNISDIDFYERECVVFGKGESERIVYFDARTKIHLMQYIQQRTDENPALFVSLNKPNTRLGISGIETRLRELGEKCNIKKVHPHKFRRTMATNAIDKGMPIEQVQKLLGHVQIDTTMQYAMVNQSNVKHAHRKFIG